jgi:hypothetical protein
MMNFARGASRGDFPKDRPVVYGVATVKEA